MALPEPHAGLVISYAYLWADEHAKGQEDGLKNRPCAIVVARRHAAGKTIVTVLPITHTPPRAPEMAMEIPSALKAHLHLDAQKSWVVLNEYNEFIWPGPDLRPTASGRFDYGVLPPGFFIRLRDRLLGLAGDNRVRNVRRTD